MVTLSWLDASASNDDNTSMWAGSCREFLLSRRPTTCTLLFFKLIHLLFMQKNLTISV